MFPRITYWHPNTIIMTEELVRRFFNKQCTAEEAEQVVHYLKNNPLILEQYAGRKDWDDTVIQQMPDEFWKEVWQQIEIKRRPVLPMLWLKRAAVAAGIILMLGIGYSYMTEEKKAVVVAKTEKLTQQPVNTMNNTADAMHVNLPDGSIVLLSPGSVINYNAPFDDDKRDVQLEGEGRFTVQKDQSKPFTVYAGNLATTALGTEFTINTKATGNKSISIKLHTGKVVIKQTGNITKVWDHDILLDPGEQLEYNHNSLTTAVSKISDEKPAVAAKIKSRKKRAVPSGNNELLFTSSPLTEVIAKLETYFATDISYDSVQIATMNFTGTISKNDSLPIVLKVIAQMNELELTHETNGYRLSKQ